MLIANDDAHIRISYIDTINRLFETCLKLLIFFYEAFIELDAVIGFWEHIVLRLVLEPRTADVYPQALQAAAPRAPKIAGNGTGHG